MGGGADAVAAALRPRPDRGRAGRRGRGRAGARAHPARPGRPGRARRPRPGRRGGFVVDAMLRAARRAAVVLRVLEDRSDEEIAEVLGTSQAFARTQVQRGLASLHQDLPADRDGALLERLDRDATSAPTHLARPSGARRRSDAPAASRRPGSPRSRCWRWWSRWRWSPTRPARRPGVITYPPVHVPTDWRYESYDGVAGAGARRPGASAGRRSGPTSSTDAWLGVRHQPGRCALGGRRRDVRLLGDAVRRPAVDDEPTPV